MKTIYSTNHDGVIGVIEEPDRIDPNRPLRDQLMVKIGVDTAGVSLEPKDFESRARLVVLELLNYIKNELRMKPKPKSEH